MILTTRLKQLEQISVRFLSPSTVVWAREPRSLQEHSVFVAYLATNGKTENSAGRACCISFCLMLPFSSLFWLLAWGCSSISRELLQTLVALRVTCDALHSSYAFAAAKRYSISFSSLLEPCAAASIDIYLLVAYYSYILEFVATFARVLKYSALSPEWTVEWIRVVAGWLPSQRGLVSYISPKFFCRLSS